jgi:uncharacterized protein (TIGR02588 family)
MTARTRQRRSEIPPWEWAIAGVGLVILLSMLAYLISRARGGHTSPPSIVITTDSVTRSAGGFLVSFSASNRGGRTAAAVQIEGTLASPDSVIEQSMATLDYLPARSHRTGGLFFTVDPRQHRLSLRATGFATP